MAVLLLTTLVYLPSVLGVKQSLCGKTERSSAGIVTGARPTLATVPAACGLFAHLDYFFFGQLL